MADCLTLTAEYLGISIDEVGKCRVEGDDVVVVLDQGIAGGRKYRIPLSDLPAYDPPELEPEPPVDDLGIYSMTYRELQAVAKEFGVQANQKQAGLIAELEALFAGDEEEE